MIITFSKQTMEGYLNAVEKATQKNERWQSINQPIIVVHLTMRSGFGNDILIRCLPFQHTCYVWRTHLFGFSSSIAVGLEVNCLSSLSCDFHPLLAIILSISLVFRSPLRDSRRRSFFSSRLFSTLTITDLDVSDTRFIMDIIPLYMMIYSFVFPSPDKHISI